MKRTRIVTLLMCLILCIVSVVAAPAQKSSQKKKASTTAVAKKSQKKKSSKKKSSSKKSSKKTQTKKVSHKYNEQRLESVIQDIAERGGYTLVYDPADIDAEKPVTMKFKDVAATSAIKKVLGKQYDVKGKKGQITITRKPVPPETYVVKALAPSSVYEDSLMTVSNYEDTLYAVSCKKVSREIKPGAAAPKPATRKGHYLMFGVGGGYSSLGYQLVEPEGYAAAGERAGRNWGGPGGNLRLQYAYFFHENWGFSLGAGASYYSSFGVMDNMKSWYDVTDSDGERYEHQALTHKWTEVQRTLMVDVPLALQMQYPIKDDFRFYASVGVKAGFPLYNTYALKKGELQHQGFYDKWNLTLDMDGHDFYTEQVGQDFAKDNQTLALQKWSVAATADLGFLVPLSEQLDLMVGAYFNYTCNNVSVGKTHDMAWMQPDKTGGYKHEFMQTTYAGEVGSEYVKNDAVRPWGAGLTLGILWHHKEKEKPQKSTWELYEKCDTTFTLQQRADTVMKPQKEAAKEIQKLMKKSVIWFNVNSADPILEPADILDKLAELLVENPDQKILVNGHASKEGNARVNRRLSEQRAKAVADMLIAKGVKPAQIKVQSFSSDVDYDAGDGSEHKIALDRRVEIIPVDE